MPSTFLSPKGRVIRGSNAREIIFPAMAEWKEVDQGIARVKLGSPEAPWSPGMADAVAEWQKGGRGINLTPNGRCRIGVSIALLIDTGGKLAPVFSQFNETHPTRPLQLTPPAGVLGGRDIFMDALGELGQEIILTVPGDPTTVGHWSYEDDMGLHTQILEEDWVKDFSVAHGYKLDENFKIPIELAPFDDLISFKFGRPGNWEQIITGWMANEFDTGSFEIIIPVIAKLPLGVVLVDGEILPNGEYRGSKVITMYLTDKAEVIMKHILSIKNR